MGLSFGKDAAKRLQLEDNNVLCRAQREHRTPDDKIVIWDSNFTCSR